MRRRDGPDMTFNDVSIYHHPGHFHYWFHPRFHKYAGAGIVCTGPILVPHLFAMAHMVLGPDGIVKAVPIDRV